MDKFQDAYREAMEELPKLHMDAGRVQDELHHYKMLRQGRKYLITRGCTAAAVFLLCGVGTVAAKSFRDSIIRVNDNGFVITSENALAETETGKEIPDTMAVPDAMSILRAGGVFSTEDDIPDEELLDEAEVVEYGPQMDEYDSLAAFFAGSDVAAGVPVPDGELLGMEFTNENVHVMDGGKRVFITLCNEDVYFSLTQSDNRGYESYSSATAYMGESRNERIFTNSQGMNYVVIDSVDENEAVISVHAAISVNGRDLTLSFQGFEEVEVEKILYGLDLSVYFQE